MMCPIIQLLCELSAELASILIVLEHRHHLPYNGCLGAWGAAGAAAKNKQSSLDCTKLKGLQSLWPGLLVVPSLVHGQSMNISTDGCLCKVQTPMQRVNEGKWKYCPKRNKRNLHKLALICDLPDREFKVTGHKDAHWSQRTIHNPEKISTQRQKA